MLNKSLRYVLIAAILALFLAVFISSTESELNSQDLTKKKKAFKPLKITIKKPTAQKSNVVKKNAAKSVQISTKTTLGGGGGGTFTAKGKTTTSVAGGKTTTKIEGSAKIITSGKKSITHDGVSASSSSHGESTTSQPSHMSILKSISPSMGKPSTFSSGSEVESHTSSSNSNGEGKQKFPLQLNNLTQNGSLTNARTLNHTGEIFYYPFPNNFNFPNGTIILSSGSYQFPNRTILEATKVAEILTRNSSKEAEQRFQSVRYPHPNIYQFPAGTMISGNGSIIFANGTELTASQFGKMIFMVARSQPYNKQEQNGKPLPFPNEYGLPNNTLYFESNQSFVFSNGTTVTREKIFQMKPPAQQETPIKHFGVPNPYNFPNQTALYRNNTVVFPNKTVLSSEKFLYLQQNTPLPIHMPNSFGYKDTTLVYPNGSLIIQSEKKIALNQTISKLLRLEMQVFQVAQLWPQPNKEGFPKGTRYLGNSTILFPNNTYSHNQTILKGPIALQMQGQIKNLMQPNQNSNGQTNVITNQTTNPPPMNQNMTNNQNNQWMNQNMTNQTQANSQNKTSQIYTQQPSTNQNTNSTRLDVGVKVQSNATVSTNNKTLTTNTTTNGAIVVNGKQG